MVSTVEAAFKRMKLFTWTAIWIWQEDEPSRAKGRLDVDGDDGGRYEGTELKDSGTGKGALGWGEGDFVLRLAQQRSRFMLRENGRRRRVVGGCRLRN